MPTKTEMRRLLAHLEDPANDGPSKDRYVAVVAGGAVLEALRLAIATKHGCSQNDPKFSRPGLAAFKDRISEAARSGIVTGKEATELRRIMRIRHAFAHALAPLSFEHADIAEMTKRLFHHPISDWASYFAPAFAPRRHFAIVCAEFVAKLSNMPKHDPNSTS